MPILSTPRFLVPALIVSSLLLLAACGTPQGNAENGKKWFAMNNCTSCHGPHANDGKAPQIAGFDMGFRSFLAKLRTKDAPIMPFFPESKISKQDAADIYAYLKSIK